MHLPRCLTLASSHREPAMRKHFGAFFISWRCQTDFRRAVAARQGESIVFTRQNWPDKASFYAAENEPPFDARRFILGCFEPIVATGRERFR
jgi:uncharacterized protein YbaA (DUF1428 family)